MVDINEWKIVKYPKFDKYNCPICENKLDGKTIICPKCNINLEKIFKLYDEYNFYNNLKNKEKKILEDEREKNKTDEDLFWGGSLNGNVLGSGDFAFEEKSIKMIDSYEEKQSKIRSKVRYLIKKGKKEYNHELEDEEEKENYEFYKKNKFKIEKEREESLARYREKTADREARKSLYNTIIWIIFIIVAIILICNN